MDAAALTRVTSACRQLGTGSTGHPGFRPPWTRYPLHERGGRRAGATSQRGMPKEGRGPTSRVSVCNRQKKKVLTRVRGVTSLLFQLLRITSALPFHTWILPSPQNTPLDNIPGMGLATDRPSQAECVQPLRGREDFQQKVARWQGVFGI